MKAYVICLLLLTSCTAAEVGDTLLPDELTLGRGSSQMGGYLDEPQGMHDFDFDGESESTYASLTWHLPSLNNEMSRADRERIRSEAVIRDVAVARAIAEKKEREEPTMARGGALQADWRHAAAFGGLLGFLLIILLVKLKRSNGWH